MLPLYLKTEPTGASKNMSVSLKHPVTWALVLRGLERAAERGSAQSVAGKLPSSL